MIQAETRTLGYAFAGSLAVHFLLAVACAIWIGLGAFHRFHLPTPEPEDAQPEVTLVFPEPLPVPPPPQKQDENYIRTTQNTEAPKPPDKADFISDKDTAAMAKAPASPDGDAPLPTMQGVDRPTKELADRTFRDGETRSDSAPSAPQASATTAMVAPAPRPKPAATPAPPPPQKAPEPPVIAKKDDARAETMMKEFDAALAETQRTPESKPKEMPPEDKKPEEKKPDAPRETLPAMRTPDENVAPRAIPVATPVVNTPRPEKEAFQPETHRSAVRGKISNIGNEDAAAAAATPVGRYMRQVTSAIEKKWHQYRLARADAIEPGKMGLRFFVNKNGKIEDLEFLFKESNPMMEDFTIEAILKADIPPIPRDLLPILEKERVEITYDIVIHP